MVMVGGSGGGRDLRECCGAQANIVTAATAILEMRLARNHGHPLRSAEFIRTDFTRSKEIEKCPLRRATHSRSATSRAMKTPAAGLVGSLAPRHVFARPRTPFLEPLKPVISPESFSNHQLAEQSSSVYIIDINCNVSKVNVFARSVSDL